MTSHAQSTTQTSLLVANEVAVGYGPQPVLTGLSLDLHGGEFVGLVGPNGSGKSTLIRAMSRVLAPLAGSITVNGLDITRAGARWLASHLAVVPQDSPVAFDFTVFDMVLMGRSPHLGRFSVERPQDADVAWECLRLTGVESLADRPVMAISGGERQRAVIARALAQEPDVLLADEPIAHLDINHQIQVLDLLRSLARERGMGIVAALHDLNLAASYCDRLVLIAHGRVIEAGTPAQVITSEHLHTAYGIHAQVKSHPASGRPYITLGARQHTAARGEPLGVRVHVICGAGTGAEVLRDLSHAGCEVTVGVVNVADSDQQVAENLDLERIEEAPFSAISDDAYRRNCELAEGAAVVVLCGMPFGPGNLANLRTAEAALRRGRTVLLVTIPPIEERDFTDGEATRLFASLTERGARCVASAQAAVAAALAAGRGAA